MGRVLLFSYGSGTKQHRRGPIPVAIHKIFIKLNFIRSSGALADRLVPLPTGPRKFFVGFPHTG